jgi:regulator of RNase E activity RraB
MRVKINRNVCTAQLAFCEQCLGKFLREPLGYERHCFEEIEDDHSNLLTIDLVSGENTETLVLDDQQRQLAAGEGWSFFVDFEPGFYRDNPDA